MANNTAFRSTLNTGAIRNSFRLFVAAGLITAFLTSCSKKNAKVVVQDENAVLAMSAFFPGETLTRAVVNGGSSDNGVINGPGGGSSGGDNGSIPTPGISNGSAGSGSGGTAPSGDGGNPASIGSGSISGGNGTELDYGTPGAGNAGQVIASGNENNAGSGDNGIITHPSTGGSSDNGVVPGGGSSGSGDNGNIGGNGGSNNSGSNGGGSTAGSGGSTAGGGAVTGGSGGSIAGGGGSSTSEGGANGGAVVGGNGSGSATNGNGDGGVIPGGSTGGNGDSGTVPGTAGNNSGSGGTASGGNAGGGSGTGNGGTSGTAGGGNSSGDTASNGNNGTGGTASGGTSANGNGDGGVVPGGGSGGSGDNGHVGGGGNGGTADNGNNGNNGGGSTGGGTAGNGGNSGGGNNGGGSGGGDTAGNGGGNSGGGSGGGDTAGNGGGNSGGGSGGGDTAGNGGGNNGGGSGGGDTAGNGGGNNGGGSGGGDTAGNGGGNSGGGNSSGGEFPEPPEPPTPVANSKFGIKIMKVCSSMRSDIKYPKFIFAEEAKNLIISVEAIETKYLKSDGNVNYAAAGFGASKPATTRWKLIKTIDLRGVNILASSYSTHVGLVVAELKKQFNVRLNKIAISAKVCDDYNHSGRCSDKVKTPYDLMTQPMGIFTLNHIPKSVTLEVWAGRNKTFTSNPYICEKQYSPLILDLTGAGFKLQGPESGILFDLMATGVPLRTGWVSANNIAFLVRDLNRNGKITSGLELFGNATRLKNGRTAANGFEALKDLDDNDDGYFTPQDSEWKNVKLWVDTKRNGHVDSGELYSLDYAGIKSINLNYIAADEVDAFGNQTRQRSTFTRAVKGVNKVLQIIDIWFNTFVAQ